jgi:predicted transcriptional regulator
MTDKQAVLDALQRLPENASLDEITEELRIMAAIRRGRSDVAAGNVKTHAAVELALESWASAWSAVEDSFSSAVQTMKVHSHAAYILSRCGTAPPLRI